jgi:hypothetical protein
MENFFSTCFLHAVTGIFAVLFFWLASASGLTAILAMKRLSSEDPLYQVVIARLKFGAVYSVLGTLLLLITLILGVSKVGVFHLKTATTLILLFYALSLPFVASLKKGETGKLAFLLTLLGPLATLNLLIGNFVFTSFHNFL